MKHSLRNIIVALLALLAVNLAHAQADLLTGMTEGFTMPMKITGSTANSTIAIGIDTLRFQRGGSATKKDSVVFKASAKMPIPFVSGENELTLTGSYWMSRDNNDGKATNGGKLAAEIPDRFKDIPIYGDKVRMRLDLAEIAFTCDGVQSVRIKGVFLFNSDFIQSADPATPQVEAAFDVTADDWDDFLIEINSFTRFKIKGAGDFEFEVNGAVFDFSAESNAGWFVLPKAYETDFAKGDEVMWTGFALKELIVTAPKEIQEIDGKKQATGCDFSFSATNMLIDEWGLTGSFTAKKENCTKEKNSGLNVSINKVGVSIVQNHLVDGILLGTADIPFLTVEKPITPDPDRTPEEQQQMEEDAKQNAATLSLGLEGRLQYDLSTEKLRYRITVETLNDKTYGVPLTKMATISLDKGSSFTIGNDNEEKEFIATLLLNGTVNITEGNGLNMKGVRFEKLKLSTHSPHFDWERFALVGTVGMDFGGFAINLTKFDLKKSDENIDLKIAVNLELMDDKFAISAGTGVTIKANYDRAANKWKADRAVLDFIELEADFSAFRFKGDIWFYREGEGTNPSPYGNGFRGAITLTLKTLGFGAAADIQFGDTQHKSPGKSYKYWNARITANVAGAHIMLFPPAVMLKDITGGAYQRMENTLYSKKQENPKEVSLPLPTNDEIEYIPDPNVSFGFVAGIGAYFAQEKLVSANVLLEMAFNSHSGLKYVALQGQASVIVLENKEKGEPEGIVNAQMLSYYDVENKIFSTDLGVNVNIVGVIKGAGYVNIYTSPDTWHCYVGTMETPNTLEFFDLVKVKSYFMLGTIPTQMPPLNTRMLSLFGPQTYSSAGGQENTALQGKGFAFGISLSADCGFGQKRGFLFAFVELEGGSDALVNLKDTRCGNYDHHWRAYGQAYAYVNGEFGVRVRRKKFKILSVTSATVLSAQFPAPYYISGKVGFKFKVLFIKGKVNVGYSAGKAC